LGELAVARQQADALDTLYNANASQEYRIHYGQDPMVTVTMVRTWTMWLTGFPVTALRIANEAVALAERLDHPFSLAIALTTLGWLFHHLRDVEAVKQTAERLIKLSRDRNFPSYLGLGVMLAGWAKSQAGNDSEGLANITDGFAAWSATSGQLTITFMSVLLSEAHLHAQRFDDGLQVIERGLEEATKNHEQPYVPELWRLRGECLLAKGQRDDGASAFRQAIQEARALGTVMLELRAGMSLARMATTAEQRAEARDGLVRAYAGITEGHEHTEIAAAKRMIDEPPQS
jgi:predicted ATPase